MRLYIPIVELQSGQRTIYLYKDSGSTVLSTSVLVLSFVQSACLLELLVMFMINASSLYDIIVRLLVTYNRGIYRRIEKLFGKFHLSWFDAASVFCYYNTTQCAAEASIGQSYVSPTIAENSAHLAVMSSS